MDYVRLAAIAEKHGNSFYVFHPGTFRRNLDGIYSAFKSIYEPTLVAFALKANYMPELVRILSDSDHWCEVVSSMEYEIAKLYLPGQRLIFNGPCKSVEDVRRAVLEGAILNFDSFQELEMLASILPEVESISVGIRVNFDIGTTPSRFGFDFENGEFERAVDILQDTGKVKLSSLHSHYTTRERSLSLFDKRISGMIKVYESLEQKNDIEYLNIGGGFFGPMSADLQNSQNIKPPKFNEYAKVVAGRMFEFFGDAGPRLVIEPGVSMVANSMDYVVRILDRRKTRDKEILTVDGSINNLFPTGSNYLPSYEVVTRATVPSRIVDVAGNTCMEHDILMRDCEISAQPGDFIVFRNRGAYSNVYTPPFIHPAPPILGVDGEVFAARQSYLDVLSNYVH